jgi:UDP:flavonoid glycosyltransferase YjiC (YdhE family)
MEEKHVAFVLESTYGHIVPTLAIAGEVMRRGYRASYAVKPLFAPRISALGAEARVYQPLENRLKLFEEMRKHGASRELALDSGLRVFWAQHLHEETDDTFAKLIHLYQDDEPDIVVYDSSNPAGRLLARHFDVPAVEHSPMVINLSHPFWSYDEQLVLVSIPRFFQRDADQLGDRFQFIGFNPRDRAGFFSQWQPRSPGKPIILVSATTAMLPPVEYFKLVIAALGDSPWDLVLTLGDDVSPESLSPLPANCMINRSAANFEVLAHACLAIGQGGQGGTLEALYHGVPQILIPPSSIHEECAIRVAELGLGIHMPAAAATAEAIRTAAAALVKDIAVDDRLLRVAKNMAGNMGSALAVDLISRRLMQ